MKGVGVIHKGIDIPSAIQESALLEAGFEPLENEEGLLRDKDGVYYGREAALQRAQSRLFELYGYKTCYSPYRAVEEREADR